MKSLASRYVKFRPIYNSDTIAVHTGQDLATGAEVIIKSATACTVEELNAIFNESLLQRGLVHPNVCQLIAFFLESIDGVWVTNIVLEKLESDLETEVLRRKDEGTQFEERELVGLLQQVSSALCFAKSQVAARQKIAHRDLKPANIFIARDGTYKVGDFGSASCEDTDRKMFTLKGTQDFLSPQLKQAYSDSLFSGVNQASYNTFKSDVYSLGITVIYAATLGNIQPLRGLTNLQQKTDELISWLHCSDGLKSLLRYMMQTEEASRCDMEYIQQRVTETRQANPMTCYFETVSVGNLREEMSNTLPPQRYCSAASTSMVNMRVQTQQTSVSACAYCKNPLNRGDHQSRLSCGRCVICTNCYYTGGNLCSCGMQGF